MQDTFDPNKFDEFGNPIVSPENVGKVEGAEDGDGANMGTHIGGDNEPVDQRTEPEHAHRGEVNTGASSIASSIGAQMSEREAGHTASETANERPQAQEAVPFDITQLTAEQLSTLKAMLNATPDKAIRKKEKPVCRIKIYNSKYVVDFKNAFIGVVHDYDLNRDVEKQMIPILLEGETEFKNIRYREFRNLPEAKCDIMAVDTEEYEVEEGTVISKQTGREVPMVTIIKEYSYRIKTPDGRELTLTKVNH